LEPDDGGGVRCVLHEGGDASGAWG
jgi:hypothetical protein